MDTEFMYRLRMAMDKKGISASELSRISGVGKYGRTKEHKKILEAGGRLPEWIEFGITPYTLRKAFCRFCRDNKVELNTCIRWMGHKDASMILKVYDEVSDDRSAAEAERINSLFEVQNEVQKKNA